MSQEMSSHDFNQKFDQAAKTLKKVEDSISSIKNLISVKLKIIEAEYKYAAYCQSVLKTATPEKCVCALFHNQDGYFDCYGTDVIPKSVKSPINLFNIHMSGLNTYYFRQDMKASVEGNEAEEYLNIFKHDSLKTEPFYKEFTQDQFILTLELSDLSNVLYPTRFNVIEIDSFLKGSFTLSSLTIYTLNNNDEENTEETLPIIFTDFSTLGQNRIILDQKYHFYKIEFKFKLNFPITESNTTYYPFALKHIYLYDQDFTDDSFVITPITCDDNIAIVKNMIKVYSNRSVEITTIEDTGIELYMKYSNNTLSLPFNPSTNSKRYEIALNQNVVYAKIPLNKALSYIKFYVETRTEEADIDKSKLIDLLCDCILANRIEDQYTADSWLDYESALIQCKTLLNETCDQNTIDDATIVLINAIENLILC